MRFLLCCAFALLVPSAAWAERIYMTGASATYWSATDEIEIRVWFDGSLDLTSDFFMVGGQLPFDDHRVTNELFSIRNDMGPNVFGDTLRISHVSYGRDGRREVVTTTPMGTVDYALIDRSITLTLPFEQTGIASPLFRFGAIIQADGYYSGLDVDMFSSIDERIVYTPEPSSVALASLGIVVLLVHRFGRRRREV